ncbi:class II glutamine amidotransferase [Mumia zhuanghuii]|uniref:class II glutamine amidotransferase n=1 Tax=Mumia zhuanghuii TaxID=2585211 RepID=UPI001E50D5D2|nr:class II glutamine amidotransferase [Mumia zhuanghuii]
MPNRIRDLAMHIESPLVFSHIRASIGSPVQQTNCHPFRHGRWLWMHNGYLDGFGAMKRDLMMAVDPELFPSIEGSTDGETIWGFRYSSEGRSRSLFHSTDVSTLRVQHPDNPMLHGLSDDTRLVVPEPLGDLRGVA